MFLTNKNIFAVILSHNCEHLITKTLERIPENIFDEIIVSDDGSSDNSVKIYKEMGYKVFETPVGGYGSNSRNGVKSAFNCGADYAVEIHGDGAQFDPSAIINAKKLMEEGADLILGSRFLVKGRARKLGMPLPRFLANRGLSFFDRIILNRDLSEFHTGFRVYGKNIMNVYNDSFSNDHLCSFQIIAATIAKGLSVEEIEVECDYRCEHTSHSYAGASLYAILHFGVLLQFILHKYFKLSYGVFKNDR
jgi:glycosyltransferase involved in cell wall biosynthesis